LTVQGREKVIEHKLGMILAHSCRP
jgi:hypothetical protein